ncbi:hypothetical protein L4D76_19475 [Photobacterium sagamiensis]|uniref:hypothetical protein n=1 Tax=Photobacterium sagamiensis TaxID=2910241 RepID=UPI003D1187A3
MNYILNNPMTLAFCGVIFLLFVVALVRLHTNARNILEQLKTVNTKLSELKHRVDYDDEGEVIEHSWQPDCTSIAYQNYEQMKVIISNVCCLKTLWKEYTRSMQLPNKDYQLKPTVAPSLRNTIHVKEMFNFSEVVEHNLNIRLFTSIPNMLTGLGLLFTFVGLMIGIGEASIGLSSNNIDAAKESLNPLLRGASIAFTTSVVGLILSIIFSFYEKFEFHKLEISVKMFSDYLTTHIEFVDADKLASMQLQATQEQTKALADFQLDQQRITDETITRVSKEFRESLVESAGKELNILGELIGDMNSRLEKNITDFSESQQKMQSVASELTNTIERSFSKVTTQLTNTMDDIDQRERERTEHIVNSFSVVMGDIEKTNKDANTSLDSLHKRIENNMEASAARTTELIQQAATASSTVVFAEVEKITSTIEGSFSKVTTQLTNTMDDIDLRERERTERIVNSFSEVMGDIEKTNTDAHTSLDSLHKRIESNMETSAARTTELIQQAATASSKAVFAEVEKITSNVIPEMVTNISATMSDSLDGFATRMRQTETGMSALLEQLPGSVDQLVKMNREVSGNIEVITRLQKMTHDSVSKLNFTIKEMNQSSENLKSVNDKATETGKIYFTLMDSINNVVDKNSENTQSINTGMHKIKKALDVHQANQSGFESNLNVLFNSLENGLGNYTQSTNEYMRSLDQHTASITGSLVEAVKELKTTVQMLEYADEEV